MLSLVELSRSRMVLTLAACLRPSMCWPGCSFKRLAASFCRYSQRLKKMALMWMTAEENMNQLRRAHNMEAQIDRRIKLPPARYLVEQKIVGRGHQYHVTEDSGKVTKLPGVTGVLNIISKDALVRWSANQAAEDIGFSLTSRLDNSKSKKVSITDDF